MKIPFLNLTHHSAGLSEDINEALARVIERGNFILGQEVEAFENEWAQFCEAKGAVGVANGTDAITLALIASNRIEAGDEVITTPLSAAYTALGIVNAGAKPVFVDIDEKTFNLDAQKIEQAITPRTRAIVPVHLYGQTADMQAIKEIAERRNLIVIEDAAQAHGARFDGKPCGSSSLAATFSFYPTKNLGALGDGGAVISSDTDFLQRTRLLRQGGHAEAFEMDLIGRNSRLDEIQAAILRVKLKRLDEWNARRRELAEIYFERLKDLPAIQLSFVRNKSEAVFHLFVIRCALRDELKDFLAEKGIGSAVHYPYLLHEQKNFRSAEQRSLPVAEKICAEILSLPLSPQMENSQIETVCDAIEEFENKNSSAFSNRANR
ncbi:MAG TPA: DegT/DnrJ/EryC1/StrS family aminotransferase [Pyrinomonadaceae bacterium]|nr:DegT/DnrJ/EryC1/StrS family aminotransferase [Pyrinomonadaceae bacterium]